MSKVTKGMSTANPSVKGSFPTTTPAIKGSFPSKTPSIASAKIPVGTDWDAEQHHRTLMEAEHIKADPVKMHKVRQIAGRKLAAASSIKSLSDIQAAAKRLREGKMPHMASISATATPKEYDNNEYDGEAENHHSTLMQAEEIKSNRHKMDKVRQISAAKMAAAKNIHEHAHSGMQSQENESAEDSAV